MIKRCLPGKADVIGHRIGPLITEVMVSAGFNKKIGGQGAGSEAGRLLIIYLAGCDGSYEPCGGPDVNTEQYCTQPPKQEVAYGSQSPVSTQKHQVHPQV